MVSTGAWLALLTASIGTLLILTLLGVVLAKRFGSHYKTTMAYYSASITLTGFGMWYHNPYGVDNIVGILYELGAIMFIPYGLILILIVEVHDRTKQKYQNERDDQVAG